MAYEVLPCSVLTPVRKDNGKWREERVPRFQVRETETGWETLGYYTTQEAAAKIAAELEVSRPVEVYKNIDLKRLMRSRRQQKQQEIEDLKKEIREQSGE